MIIKDTDNKRKNTNTSHGFNDLFVLSLEKCKKITPSHNMRKGDFV